MTFDFYDFFTENCKTQVFSSDAFVQFCNIWAKFDLDGVAVKSVVVPAPTWIHLNKLVHKS